MAAPKVGFMSKLGSVPKKAGMASLIAAGVVAVPFLVSGIRSKRAYDPSAALPPEPASQVLVDPASMGMDAPPSMANPVHGEWASKVRGQAQGGIDPNSPSIIGADGRNVIDGSSSVQRLGGREV